MTKARTSKKEIEAFVLKVRAMRIGTSFFVPDVTRQQMEWLRRPVLRAGVGITIVRVECDEIYQCPGVRVWREEGEYDEL